MYVRMITEISRADIIFQTGFAKSKQIRQVYNGLWVVIIYYIYKFIAATLSVYQYLLGKKLFYLKRTFG